MRLLLPALFCAAAAPPASGTAHGLATLSNTALPRDTDGRPLITGEASVLQHEGEFYFYFNNWGGCPGVDCCPTVEGCSSCCFKDHDDPCVYTSNHSVVVYRTRDLTQWQYLGEALPPSRRLNGTEFRPCVVFNRRTEMFVMWYEDRHTGQKGYAVAVSRTPEGPFRTVNNSVRMQGRGRQDESGDFNILVDDDGTAYHVRDGLVVERLSEDYTQGSGVTANIATQTGAEGPVFFKRNGSYYVLAGSGCCACRGGSSMLVYTAEHPLGPYTFRGDAGSNTSQVFNRHSPLNYVTHAQASSVFTVTSAAGENQTVWLGNQWVTSQEPGHPRNHDLLYWAPLRFAPDGSVEQLERRDSVTISL